jgi:hypothetical protein
VWEAADESDAFKLVYRIWLFFEIRKVSFRFICYCICVVYKFEAHGTDKWTDSCMRYAHSVMTPMPGSTGLSLYFCQYIYLTGLFVPD